MENIPPPFAVYPLGFHDSQKNGAAGCIDLLPY